MSNDELLQRELLCVCLSAPYAICPPQIWFDLQNYALENRLSQKLEVKLLYRQKSAEDCLVSLKFGMWYGNCIWICESSWIVKIHFWSNPRWQAAPKLRPNWNFNFYSPNLPTCAAARHQNYITLYVLLRASNIDSDISLPSFPRVHRGRNLRNSEIAFSACTVYAHRLVSSTFITD